MATFAHFLRAFAPKLLNNLVNEAKFVTAEVVQVSIAERVGSILGPCADLNLANFNCALRF